MGIQVKEMLTMKGKRRMYLKIMEILQDLQDSHATSFTARIVCDVAGIPISETTMNLFFFHPLSQSANVT